MPEDARLLELTWLSKLEAAQTINVGPYLDDSVERRVILHLLREAYVNDELPPVSSSNSGVDMERYKERHELNRWGNIHELLNRQTVRIRIGHRGAVRRAELEQQLKSGRIKDSMEMVWDGRHLRQDTRIALLDASKDHPLAVVFLDLNDVKVGFNAISNAAGDDAIRRYLGIIADLTFERAEAYRQSGGADEVVILMPRLSLDAAVRYTRKLLGALGHEVVHGLTLRAAAGVVVATDPGEPVDDLKERSAAEQARAKNVSREHEGRPSVLAWPGEPPEVQPLPAAGSI